MRGRGCVLAVLLAGPVLAETPIDAPSGQSVTLSEILLDDAPGQLWARFRFVAPAIASETGTIDPAAAAGDMQHLCDAVAVAYLVENDLVPERIVVSLSDRFVPFGQTNADATQFFELYSLRDGACIWEEF